MKVKFANGAIKECSPPTEQKLFKNIDGATVAVGWVLILRLTGNSTSSELDEILAPESSKSLEFFTENENGGVVNQFSLNGYNKVTSTTIRHAEDSLATYAEIQMSKGV